MEREYFRLQREQKIKSLLAVLQVPIFFFFFFLDVQSRIGRRELEGEAKKTRLQEGGKAVVMSCRANKGGRPVQSLQGDTGGPLPVAHGAWLV